MPSRSRAVAGAAVILLLCAMCVRLGFWQLSRLEQRRARNAVTARGLAQAPVVLDAAALAALGSDPDAWAYRRATLAGSYDATREVVLRGRSDGGRPGVHLITPLRVGDRVVLVNRGWLPAPDGAHPGQRPPPPAGPVRVSGVLMPVPRTGDGGAPSGTGARRSYRRLDQDALRASLGPGLLPLYLQAEGGTDGLPRPVPLPALDEGPHLGYAIQWFSFALIGVVGLIILLVRGGRRDDGFTPG